MPTMQELRILQGLSLDLKIRRTKQRIREWVNEYGQEGVYVSFSGGKDSTVLLHLVRELYPNIPAVFVDTGLEFPEIREFVKKIDNVVWLRPEMNFKKVIETYGYPIISKDVAQAVFDVNTQSKRMGCDKRETKLWNRSFNPDSDYGKKYPSFSRAKYDYLNDSPFLISHRCCDIIKKRPSKLYEKETGRKPIIGTMASESMLRTTQWTKDGCNAFDSKRPTSKPMSFWTEQDVLLYIKLNNIEICSIYGEIVSANTVSDIEGQLNLFDSFAGLFDIKDSALKTTGCPRIGCMFCMFGCTNRDWNNLESMKITHPKQYEWIMKSWDEGGLGYKDVVDWLNEHGNLNIKY